MLKRPIGKTELNASVIGFGAWVTGGWMWGGADEKESIKAVHAAFDHGINLFDTAPIYGFGRSEEILGKGLKDRRDKVIIATKCGLVWTGTNGEFTAYSDEYGITKDENKLKIYRYLNPASIKKEIESSLTRLKTDYIDLYQTHWQENTTPIQDTMDMLLRLKSEGKIRAIGVSNASVEQLEEYGSIDSDQEKFSMLFKNNKKGSNAEYCFKNKIAFLAYSPLVHGLLTGRMDPDREFDKGDVRKGSALFTRENILLINEMLGEFDPLCEKYGVNTGQLLLGWTFHQIGVTHLLVGARNQRQATENAIAGNLLIFEDDLIEIDEIYSRYADEIKK